MRTASGAISPAKACTNLNDLLATLLPDAAMRTKYKKLIVKAGDEAAAKKAPGKRVSE